MEPRWGEKYRVWIEGEPVPKSTQPPPIIRKRMPQSVRKMLVQKRIATDPNYAGLYRTQQYQYNVATNVWTAVDEFPQFDKRDPVMLTFGFHKTKHATGDLKNMLAAIEDGFVHSARLPDDRQVTSYGKTHTYFFSDFPGVEIIAEIDPLAEDYVWLHGWLNTSRKKTLEYAEMREIELKNAKT